MVRLPVSLQSLLIQCAATLVAALLFWAGRNFADLYPALWHLAAAQGLIAAAMSRAAGQPVWWQPLHLAFLPAAFLAAQAALPAWIYFVVFLLLVGFYWSTFRTRVPLYLSDSKAWRALEPFLPASRPFRFIDLGSGLGDVLFHLEQRFPLGQFEGTEIAPAPWLISRVRATLKRSRALFLRRDYARLDLGAYDIVFAFLSPAAMPALWQQAQAQMHAGSIFISLSFEVAGRQPDERISLADGPRHTLYVWRMQTPKNS